MAYTTVYESTFVLGGRIGFGAGGATGCKGSTRGNSEDEGHARALIRAAQSESALQPERHGGNCRDGRRLNRNWRGRSQGHSGAGRRPVDRPGSAAHRASVAGHDALLLL